MPQPAVARAPAGRPGSGVASLQSGVPSGSPRFVRHLGAAPAVGPGERRARRASRTRRAGSGCARSSSPRSGWVEESPVVPSPSRRGSVTKDRSTTTGTIAVVALPRKVVVGVWSGTRERVPPRLSTTQRRHDHSRSCAPPRPSGRRRRECGVRAVLECRHWFLRRWAPRSTHRKTPARVASQLSTAVASTSMRRSGSPSAATPMRVIGFSGSIPAVAAARMAPSPSAAILSGVQSTT